MPEHFPHGPELARRHGVFYPTSYAVVAFERAEDAAAVRDARRAAGLEGAGVLPRVFGEEVELVGRHIDLARQGHPFLIVRAAPDPETEGPMAVVRRHSYAVAHKYDRLTVEEL